MKYIPIHSWKDWWWIVGVVAVFSVGGVRVRDATSPMQRIVVERPVVDCWRRCSLSVGGVHVRDATGPIQRNRLRYHAE